MKVSRWIDTEWDKVECPHQDEKGHALEEEVHAPLHPLIASVFDEARDRWGGPLLVTSGVRCRPYQEVLRRRGERAALISPHLFGVALDVVPAIAPGRAGILPAAGRDARPAASANSADKLRSYRPAEVKALAVHLYEIDRDLRLFTARYDFRFIHLDCAYLVSKEDLARYSGLQSKPEAYRPGVRDFP